MSNFKQVKSIKVTTFPWRKRTKQSREISSKIPPSYESSNINIRKTIVGVDTTGRLSIKIRPFDACGSITGEVNAVTKFSPLGDVNSEISYTEQSGTTLGRGPITSLSLSSAFNYKNYENKKRLIELNSRSINKNAYTTLRRSSIYSNSLYPLKVYDNNFISHAIPASVYGFRWVRDNSRPDYLNSGPHIEYPQGEIYDPSNGTGNFVNFLTSSYDDNRVNDYELDLVGTNVSFYDPISLSSLSFGTESLTLGTLAPEDYNKYLSNKKHIISRSKAASFWSKERNPIIRQLNRRNIITTTSGADREIKHFRVSPVSFNNIVRVGFNEAEERYHLESRISETIDNAELSDLYIKRSDSLKHAKRRYANVRNTISASGYSTTYLETSENIFPKRENLNLSFSMKRARYSDTQFDKTKKTSSLKNFWYKNKESRIRPPGSSNSLDYKNSLYYNNVEGVVESVFPLDNVDIKSGERLVGELSYQGSSFYRNMVLKETSHYLKDQSLESHTIYSGLELQDSVKLPITSRRPLEILNAKKSLVSGADLYKNYQWGTSLNPVDLNKNFLYYTGTFYDKSKFSIDFKNQPASTSYDNKVITLSSYPKTRSTLNSFGISKKESDIHDHYKTFSLHTEGDIKVSLENKKVKIKQRKMSVRSSTGENKNVVYNFASRPTMQLFYQAKEFYGQETGFIFDDAVASPFYSSWYDFEKSHTSNGDFGSLISEFNMSRNYDIYESSANKLNTNNKAFLSLPGSGELFDYTTNDSSRKLSIETSRKYSLGGIGIREITEWPQSDNNDAWYSTRSRDGQLFENKEYRGRNISIIPSDSTFSIDNSNITSYDISKTNGYKGCTSTGKSWKSVELRVKKNAAAEFNTTDFSNDYIETRIDKFGLSENINLGMDSFAISLWYQPQEDWFNAEEEIGLFTLANELEDFSHYLSVYAKGTNGGLTIRDSFVGEIESSAAIHISEQVNNLVLAYNYGLLSVYLNSVKVIDEVLFTNSNNMAFINKILLGISKDGVKTSKYRGAIDEFYLFSGNPTDDDVNKIYSGGKPSNLMELKANDEISLQLVPVIYNRIGYPYFEEISDYKEEHDLKFLNRYVLGGSTDSSAYISPNDGGVTNKVVISGIKKLLPYNGLYPYQRIMQIGENFHKTYRLGALLEANKKTSYTQNIQSLLQPFFAPGVMFNSLRAGIECPWPIYTNATGLEPTVPYDTITTYDVENDGLPVTKICDNIVPSWYLNESPAGNFLKKYPTTKLEMSKTQSYINLISSQPKFVKGFNKAGLVINRITDSKISIQSLRDESFYESIVKSEQKSLIKAKAYQYCVLEFFPEEIEDRAGFSLFSPGRGENLNVTFTKSNNIESTSEKYSILSSAGSYDAQIEIQAYDFSARNIEKAICSLFNTHITDSEYRVISLNRELGNIANPELHVLRSVDLAEIDERLDTSGTGRFRLAIVYIGAKLNEETQIEQRSFNKASLASVSTYSGRINQALGIFYRDKYNSPERDIELNRQPFGQYDKEFYSGKDIIISTLSGKAVESSGAEKKGQQIYFLAGDHYTANPLDLKEDFVWPSFVWNKTSPDKSFAKSLNNFVEQSQKFFLKNGRPLSYHATREIVEAEPGKTYTMEVYMRKTNNFSTVMTFDDNSGKFYGSPYRYQAAFLYNTADELTDDLAFAPFAPAYHYGETVAKISFTAGRERTYTIEEVAKGSTITFSNPGMERRYKNKFGDRHKKAYDSFLQSPSYKGKNNLDSCVNFRKLTQAGHWEISLMTEFPILNYHDDRKSPTAQRPRGFLYDYGRLPDSAEGIYFGIRDTLDPSLGEEERSLIELCGFKDSQDNLPVNESKENRVGEIADQRVIKEAVVVIPYVLREYTKLTEDYALTGTKFKINQESGNMDINFFKIDREIYEGVLSGEISSESISKMTSCLEDYILPPEIDFINDKNKSPFVCYVTEAKVTLHQQDLADLWQGRLSEDMMKAEIIDQKDKNIFSHLTGENEFLHGRKFPEGTKFMVFKLKQKSSDYNRSEVVYNWPNDYMSIIEKASVKFETFKEVV